MVSFLSAHRSRRTGLFCLLALLLVVIERFVIKTPSFNQRTGLLSWAVTTDLVLGLPLLYYLAVIKPLKLSRWGVLAIASGSLAICWLILPKDARQLVIYLREGLILVELAAGLYFISSIRRIIRQYRQLATLQPDFILNLHESVRLTIGQSRPVRMLTSEIVIWRYGLLGWINTTEAKADQRAFTTHQTSGQIALLVMIMVIALIETTTVHLLLSRWSVAGAWVLTAASLYGLLFLVAETVATVRRPHLLDSEEIHLRFGVRWYGSLPWTQIRHMERISEKPDKSGDCLNGPLLTMPNVLITLREPVLFNGLYGLTKSVQQVALFVDERDRLFASFADNGEQQTEA